MSALASTQCPHCDGLFIHHPARGGARLLCPHCGGIFNTASPPAFGGNETPPTTGAAILTAIQARLRTAPPHLLVSTTLLTGFAVIGFMIGFAVFVRGDKQVQLGGDGGAKLAAFHKVVEKWEAYPDNYASNAERHEYNKQLSKLQTEFAEKPFDGGVHVEESKMILQLFTTKLENRHQGLLYNILDEEMRRIHKQLLTRDDRILPTTPVKFELRELGEGRTQSGQHVVHDPPKGHVYANLPTLADCRNWLLMHGYQLQDDANECFHASSQGRSSIVIVKLANQNGRHIEEQVTWGQLDKEEWDWSSFTLWQAPVD